MGRPQVRPGMNALGYASTEKPGKPGSCRSDSDCGAGFSRLFVSDVARRFIAGRGGGRPNRARPRTPGAVLLPCTRGRPGGGLNVPDKEAYRPASTPSWPPPSTGEEKGSRDL